MSALSRFIFTLTAIFLLVLSHVVSGVEPEIVINIERNGDAFIARQITGNAERFESELELTQSGSATRVHYRAEVVPDSGLARTFGGRFIKHEVEEQFTAMAAEMMRRNAR